MKKNFKEVVFSGVQPTGNLHLGNYLGAIKNFVELQKKMECIYCVVDLHAITVFQNPDELEERMGQVTPEFNAKHAQIHAKCSDVKRNLLIVNQMPEGTPDNPKFIVRRTFIAKRGERDSLLEYTKERWANQEQKPLVMIPLGGDADVLRMSLYFASLSDVVNAYERTIGPDNSGVRAKIADLTEKSYISLHRVISRAQN